MSGYGPDGRPVTAEKDPVLRFLGGCVLVLAGLAAIGIIGVIVVGLHLTRDETPGRPEESIVLGDETRYWCFDLKPDDAGLAVVMAKMDAEAQAARAEVLKNSPLRMFALGSRRNQLAESLPLKVEMTLAPSGAWAGRATFSHGILRMRALVKLMRWIVGHDRDEGSSVVADGVEVTTLNTAHGPSVSFAVVGNRLLLAGDVERLRRALEAARVARGTSDPAREALHAAVRLEGEDGWAFGDGPALASFDVDARDALAFRIVVAAPGGGAEPMGAERAIAIARSFLPYVEAEAFQLSAGSPSRRDDATWIVEGRIPELSHRLAGGLVRLSADRATQRGGPPEPSAIPNPPSPPPRSGPRSGTPAEPPREGSPSPAR